jgi:SAM-dependent methyltransferase
LQKIKQKSTVRGNRATLEPCPICGAGVNTTASETPRCAHCGFQITPIRPAVSCATGDNNRALSTPERIAADLKLDPAQTRILTLSPDQDTAEAELTAQGPFDLIIAHAALDRAPDVNRCMASLTTRLAPGGLLVIEVSRPYFGREKERFGKNSLQILLERYGFRLAGRPLGWRLSSLFNTRRLLAHKI